MSRACRIVLGVFLVLYLIALVLLLVGTFGLFGAERDPLSGVFLIPLGVPWNLLFGRAPEAVLPWIGAGAPLVNYLLLRWLCGRIGARRTSSGAT